MDDKFITRLLRIEKNEKLDLSADKKRRDKQIKDIENLNKVNKLLLGKAPFYVSVTYDEVIKVDDSIDEYTFEKKIAEIISKNFNSYFYKITSKTYDHGIDYYQKCSIGPSTIKVNFLILGQVKLTTKVIGVETIRAFLQAGRTFGKYLYKDMNNDKIIKNYILQFVCTSHLSKAAKKEIENDTQCVQIIDLDMLSKLYNRNNCYDIK